MDTRADKLIIAEWVVPVEPAGAVLRDHAVAIEDGRVSAVLPAAEARRIEAGEVVDLPGHALIPGLINMHGHAAMSLLRGYADDYSLETWLGEHIWPAEARHVGPEYVRDGGDLALVEMIRSGTTFFSDMYFFPEVMADRAQRAGVRAQLAFPILDGPTAWGAGPDEYIHKGLELRDDLKHDPLVSVVFGPHAPYTVSETVLARIVSIANELELPVQIHLHETAEEVEQAVNAGGPRPLAALDALGLIGPQTQCVHMTQLTGAEIERLALTGAHVVHCPDSNMKIGCGRCPVTSLLAAGVNVALGTDGAASNNDLSMLGEMRGAAMLAKAAEGGDSLGAEQVLDMATMGGARALGREHELGSITPGKLADLAAVDLSWPETQPVYDVISQLVYAAQSAQVTHTWVGGKTLMKNRELQTLDLEDVLHRARAWSERIAGEQKAGEQTAGEQVASQQKASEQKASEQASKQKGAAS